jgi:hypothetical protein
MQRSCLAGGLLWKQLTDRVFSMQSDVWSFGKFFNFPSKFQTHFYFRNIALGDF